MRARIISRLQLGQAAVYPLLRQPLNEGQDYIPATTRVELLHSCADTRSLNEGQDYIPATTWSRGGQGMAASTALNEGQDYIPATTLTVWLTLAKKFDSAQ